MYDVYFDSGTSNTRAYLLNGRNIVDVAKRNIGSKDSSIAGSNLILMQALKEMYDRLLENNHTQNEQILDIYASGMLTSPFGMKEIAHLSTPVSLKNLYDGIYTHYEDLFFKRDIHLIRGVKTVADGFAADKYNISAINNMRGEEIEIFGIIPEIPVKWKQEGLAVMLPGSHTHVAYIRQNILHDIWSVFSGELYHAVSTGTILSNSLRCDSERVDEQMVVQGYNNLLEYGINRALYICHAMKIFNASDNVERRSYLEGVITAGIISGFEKIAENRWQGINKIVLAGSARLTRAYEILFKQANNNYEVLNLAACEKQSFAVKGFIELLKLK